MISSNTTTTLFKTVPAASALFITLLCYFRFVEMFLWIIVLIILILLAMSAHLGLHCNDKSWNRNFLLTLIVLIYAVCVLVTYYLSERVFMEKAINLAAEIEKSCSENGECVRSLPGWSIHNNETGALVLSNKWRYFIHETSVHYLIQPNRKNFYLQEIYQHGRMTSINFNDGRYTISHQGTFVGNVSKEGTGRIAFESK